MDLNRDLLFKKLPSCFLKLVNSLAIFFCIFFNSRTRYNEPPAPRCFYVVK